MPINRSFCEPEAYFIPAYADDVLTFQFYLPPCDDEPSSILNGTFSDGDEDVQAHWTKTGGSDIDYTGGAQFIGTNNPGISQTGVFVIGDHYVVRLVLEIPNALEMHQGVFRVSGAVLAGTNPPTTSFDVPMNSGVFEFVVRAEAEDVLIETYYDVYSPNVEDDEWPILVEMEAYSIEMPTVDILDAEGVVMDADVGGSDMEAPIVSYSVQITENAKTEKCFRLGVRRCSDDEAWVSDLIRVVNRSNRYILIGQSDDSNIHSAPLFGRFDAFVAADRAPEVDRFVTRDSVGRFRNAYSNLLRLFSLRIAAIPEYRRDFLFWLFGSNVVAVDDGSGAKDYFAYSEPEVPSFPENMYGLATMTVVLAPKEELNEHIYGGDGVLRFPPYILGEKKTGTVLKAGDNAAFEVK